MSSSRAWCDACPHSSFDPPVKPAQPDSFILARPFHTVFGTLIPYSSNKPAMANITAFNACACMDFQEICMTTLMLATTLQRKAGVCTLNLSACTLDTSALFTHMLIYYD